MHDVTGATAVSLVPTVGDDVVKQLNAAASRMGWGWLVTIAGFFLGLVALLLSWVISLVIWILLAPLGWWLFLRDQAQRTVVLFYDVNDAPAAWFHSLVRFLGMVDRIAEAMARCSDTTCGDALRLQAHWRCERFGEPRCRYRHDGGSQAFVHQHQRSPVHSGRPFEPSFSSRPGTGTRWHALQRHSLPGPTNSPPAREVDRTGLAAERRTAGGSDMAAPECGWGPRSSLQRQPSNTGHAVRSTPVQQSRRTLLAVTDFARQGRLGGRIGLVVSSRQRTRAT